MGLYLEPTAIDSLPAARLAGNLLGYDGPLEAERFCDDDGSYKRKYDVYKLTIDGKAYVLKKFDLKKLGSVD